MWLSLAIAEAATFTTLAKFPGAAPALPVKSFIDSIGVNTHITYDSPGYHDISTLIGCLDFLGLKHARDQAPLPSNLPRYERMAAAGIKFDLVLSGNGNDLSAELPLELEATRTLVNAYPGSVASLEGPNEVNAQADYYLHRSLRSPLVARQAMRLISDQVRSDPVLNRLPIVSLSISEGNADWRDYQERLGSLSSFVDAANWHVYFEHGRQPSAYVTAMYQDAQRTARGKPVVFTELGYFTGYLSETGDGVDESTQAKNTLNGILDAFTLHVARTYLYELTEGHPNPSPSSFEGTFGLFHSDGGPKKAAVAVHNMTSILADTRRSADTPGIDGLDYTLKGLPSTGNALLLKKPNGKFYLILWNEARDWSARQRRAVSMPPVPVRVGFRARVPSLAVYDPIRGTQPIEKLNGIRLATVPITDHPVILEIAARDGTIHADE